MTKDQVSKILAVFSIAGVKFEANKEDVLNLWAECLEDLEFGNALKATKAIIKETTDLFANGLIAKVREKAKLLEDIEEIYRKINQDNKRLKGA